MFESQIFFAPAKINLRLEVLGRRPDGYHDLQMIMLALDLGDRLIFEPSDTLYIDCDDSALPVGESNLVMRAVRSFENATNTEVKARIHLEKRTPIAAGMGGGSSDAATTLYALNLLFDARLDNDSLEEIGATIGADVPFFIRQGHKVAQGIGERLTPLTLEPELNLVLINPGYAVSTAEIFQKIQLTRSIKEHKLPSSLKGLVPVIHQLRNDLEPVVFKDHPQLADIRGFLDDSGCVGCLMTGSGPTVFGIFENASEPDQVADKARKRGWLAWAAKTQANWRFGK